MKMGLLFRLSHRDKRVTKTICYTFQILELPEPSTDLEPILKFSTFELKLLFISCEFNNPGVMIVFMSF